MAKIQSQEELGKVVDKGWQKLKEFSEKSGVDFNKFPKAFVNAFEAAYRTGFTDGGTWALTGAESCW